MKVIDIKENKDGSADIKIEFDSKEEYGSYLKISEEKGLTLQEFFIEVVKTHAENVIKENK